MRTPSMSATLWEYSCSYRPNTPPAPQNRPFPFSGDPQSPADHALALHELNTMNALRDT